MGGVFGFLDSRRRTDAGHVFETMASAMCHKEWYVVDKFTGPGSDVALGRIGINIFNPEEQPITNEDDSLMIFMDGEIYDYADLRRELEDKGHIFQVGKDPELVLHLFEEEGDSFINYLQGSFTLAIWDSAAEVLTIANDRYGLRPLYYTHYDEKFVFAPEVKAILKAPGYKRVLNNVAVAEFFRFQQLLGEKTFFEGVQLLPHASILKYDARRGSLTITPYWDFDQIEINKDISFDDAVIEAARLFREAVDRLTFGDHTYGVYLSGGLDSRMIVGFLGRKHFPVHSATYGVRGCGDEISARRIARKVGSQHHYYEFVDGSWVAEFASLHVKLAECALSWMHSHGISTLASMRDHIDVHLGGFLGDTLLGGFLSARELIHAPDEITRTILLFNFYAQVKGTQFWENEERYFYQDPFASEANGLAYESFVTEAEKFSKYDPQRSHVYFNILNRDRRMLLHLPFLGRSHFEQRFVFWDYKLFEFACSLPPEYKLKRKLQLAIINRELPELALVPWQPVNILPTSNMLRQKAYTWKKGLVRLVNKQIQDFLPQWVPKLSTPLVDYCDYAGWLRRELRDWAEGIAFDDKTLQRGIFNPVYLHSISERHMSGVEDCTRKIAAITTFELFLRETLN